LKKLLRIVLYAGIYSSFVLVLAACSDPGAPSAATSVPRDDGQAVKTEPETKPRPSSLDQMIGFSSSDLAKRLGIEPDSITLLGAHEVKWRSGALGCPEPGMNYTQAIVPGLLILLKAGAKQYNYHAKIDGKPFYCPRERAELPALDQPDGLT
jgi:hypothetical protein